MKSFLLLAILSFGLSSHAYRVGNGGDVHMCFTTPQKRQQVENIIRTNIERRREIESQTTTATPSLSSVRFMEDPLQGINTQELGIDISEVELLDFFLKKNVPGREIIAAGGRTSEQILDQLMETLRTKSTFYQYLQEARATMPLDESFMGLTNSGVMEILDEEVPIHPNANCLFLQLGFQDKVRENFIEVYFDLRPFNLLPNSVHQAGFYLHEWLYHLYVKYNPGQHFYDSRIVREVSSLLLSTQFVSMTGEELNLRLTNYGLLGGEKLNHYEKIKIQGQDAFIITDHEDRYFDYPTHPMEIGLMPVSRAQLLDPLFVKLPNVEDPIEISGNIFYFPESGNLAMVNFECPVEIQGVQVDSAKYYPDGTVASLTLSDQDQTFIIWGESLVLKEGSSIQFYPDGNVHSFRVIAGQSYQGHDLGLVFNKKFIEDEWHEQEGQNVRLYPSGKVAQYFLNDQDIWVGNILVTNQFEASHFMSNERESGEHLEYKQAVYLNESGQLIDVSQYPSIRWEEHQGHQYLFAGTDGNMLAFPHRIQSHHGELIIAGETFFYPSGALEVTSVYKATTLGQRQFPLKENSTIRFHENGRLKQLMLSHDFRIDGILVKGQHPGTEVFFYDNYRLKQAILAEPITVNSIVIPADSKVQWDQYGNISHVELRESSIYVEGHRMINGHGSSFGIDFYPNGSLKQATLSPNPSTEFETEIDDINCLGSESITFFPAPNGRPLGYLKSCYLAGETEVGSEELHFSLSTQIHLYPNGEPKKGVLQGDQTYQGRRYSHATTLEFDSRGNVARAY